MREHAADLGRKELCLTATYRQPLSPLAKVNRPDRSTEKLPHDCHQTECLPATLTSIERRGMAICILRFMSLGCFKLDEVEISAPWSSRPLNPLAAGPGPPHPLKSHRSRARFLRAQIHPDQWKIQVLHHISIKFSLPAPYTNDRTTTPNRHPGNHPRDSCPACRSFRGRRVSVPNADRHVSVIAACR